MAAYLLSLRDDVTCTEPATGEARLQVPGRPGRLLSFRQVSPAIREAFAHLRAGDASDEELAALVMEADGPQGLFKLNHFLAKLGEARLLCRAVALDGRPGARLVPLSDLFTFSDAVPGGMQRLSRFAVVRRDRHCLVVESPLGFASVEMHDARLAAGLQVLTRPVTGAAVADSIGVDRSVGDQLLTLLSNAGALTGHAAHADGEDQHPALMQWEPHDLYFHSRSRMGRHASPFGGTYPFAGRVPPPPAVRPRMSSERISLPTPDVATLSEHDVPFTRVLEARRSIRDHADEPITLVQLAEFLHRTVRVKEVVSTEHGDVTRRPYPAGGALYESEIYLVVDRVNGLESGLYHYDPGTHELEALSDRTKAVSALLDQAFYTADQRSRPQVLIVITARFQRLQWKYRSMVYAAVLKHVGVIQQTMYLVATAMGLAPCALGGGHSDLFAEAAGLDYYTEGSVGEFILGTTAATATADHHEGAR